MHLDVANLTCCDVRVKCVVVSGAEDRREREHAHRTDEGLSLQTVSPSHPSLTGGRLTEGHPPAAVAQRREHLLCISAHMWEYKRDARLKLS